MPDLPRRVLILCVDRDNDVGLKLGVSTPVIGRENVLSVATQYMLRSPEDSDANAMFKAVQLYDSLSSALGRDNVEVSLVAGSASEDYTADLKLLREVDQVLSRFNAEAIIVVIDSPTDELVVPLLQSRRPVISIQRVVVRQARGFEELVVLAKHYVLKALEEPRYRKYLLGVPGSLIALYGVWMMIPDVIKPYASSILSILIGLMLLVFAFNVHKVVAELVRRHELTFFASLTSIAIAIAYPLSNICLFGRDLMYLVTTRLTIFDVLSICIGLVLAANVIETHVKRRATSYGKLVVSTLALPFPALILNGLCWYVFGLISFLMLIVYTVSYLAINVTSLMLFQHLRRHEARL